MPICLLRICVFFIRLGNPHQISHLTTTIMFLSTYFIFPLETLTLITSVVVLLVPQAFSPQIK
jgi:hypothetical protein